MAKSNGFFSLRRGSTKSLTFSVLNGKQITKDRVSQVRNPRSNKQQYQRAIMATVMAAYSAMKAIEDHAFEGKSKGSANQREFMSRNLVKMRNAIASYLDAAAAPAISAQQFVSVGPKVPTCLPCAWDISRGSLANSNFLKFEDNGSHVLVIPMFSEEFINTLGEQPSSTLGAIADQLGVYPGLQRTWLTISIDRGVQIYAHNDQNGGGYAPYEFHYARLVIKEFDRTTVVSSPQSGTAGLTDLMGKFINAVADTDKTSSSLLENVDDINIDNNLGFTYDAELALSSAFFDESMTKAIGEITSEVDTGKRSTSAMQTYGWEASRLLGLTYEYIAPAWANMVTNVGESELYLEGGE